MGINTMSAKYADSEWQAYAEESPGVGGESLTGFEYMSDTVMQGTDVIQFNHAAIVENGAVVACSKDFYGAGWDEYIGDFEGQLTKLAAFVQAHAQNIEDDPSGSYYRDKQLPDPRQEPQYLAWVNETNKKENEEVEGEAKYMTIKLA